MSIFDRLAKYCEKTYGIPYIREDKEEDGYFICAECDEPIYSCDWSEEEFMRGDLFCCPICDFSFCSIYEI